jgi:hypothetical protein
MKIRILPACPILHETSGLLKRGWRLEDGELIFRRAVGRFKVGIDKDEQDEIGYFCNGRFAIRGTSLNYPV